MKFGDGISGDHIIGPMSLVGNSNELRYLQMLQNSITQKKIMLLPEFPPERVILQQDGAPQHYIRDLRNGLDATYPGRMPGRRGQYDHPSLVLLTPLLGVTRNLKGTKPIRILYLN